MDKCVSNAAIRRAWLDASLTSAEAAAAVGLSRVQIWLRAKQLGLPPRRDGRREVIPADELRVLWLGNVKCAAIASLYGSAACSVAQAARRIGLPARPKHRLRPIGLAEFRLSLVRKAYVPGEKLTAAERSILQRTRMQ